MIHKRKHILGILIIFEKQNEKELDETQQKILGHIWKGLEGAE